MTTEIKEKTKSEDTTENVEVKAEDTAEDTAKKNGNANVTEEDVMEALRAVIDPELHLDVVALGLIRTVDLKPTPIEVKMLLTTPFCPYGPWMVGQVKDTAQKAVDGKEVKVEVLPEMWNPEMMEDPTMLGFF